MPDTLVGVWERHSLSIFDKPAFEDSEVIWLQTRAYFADMRTARQCPAARPAAFSGRIAWTHPHITFQRDLDLASGSIHDQAELQLLGDELLERGVFLNKGRRIPYEERWRRRHDSRCSRRVLEGCLPGISKVSMRLVEVADVALVLLDQRPTGGDFTAAHFVRRGGQWLAWRRIGSAAITPPPEHDLQPGADGFVSLRTEDRIWASRRWSLPEHSHHDLATSPT